MAGSDSRTANGADLAGGPVIGIPRAMLYFKQGAFWTAFLESLGCRVKLSRRTDRAILDDGVKLSMDESCLPAKIYLGHVNSLVGKVDRIFVCRQENFRAGEMLCTKMWGLPDICRNTIEGAEWLELNLSPALEGETLKKAWFKVGRSLGYGRRRILGAYRAAQLAQASFEELLLTGCTPEQAMRLLSSDKYRAKSTRDTHRNQAGELSVALLGHSYLVHDHLFGKPIAETLRELGAEVHTLESAPKEKLQQYGREISPTLHWTYNREIVGAMEHFIREGADGLVLVEGFPCGPDSLVLELATRKLKGRAPMIRLVLDELQSMSGMHTRLESFVDVLEMRREQACVSK